MGVEQEGEKVLTDYTFLTFGGGEYSKKLDCSFVTVSPQRRECLDPGGDSILFL